MHRYTVIHKDKIEIAKSQDLIIEKQREISYFKESLFSFQQQQ